jgi:RNA polymerase sigma-B factor
MVHSLASRFFNRGESREDLTQVAFVGLLEAYDRFDPEIGVAFGAYATAVIIGKLKHHFRDRRWTVRMPRKLQDDYLRVRTVAEQLTQRLGRSPHITEIAIDAGLSVDEVLESFEAGRSFHTTPVDHTQGNDDEGGGVQLGDIDAFLAGTATRLSLSAAIARLSERDRLILHLRFDKDMTQQEIAVELGISQMQVSRHLRRILDRLKAWFSYAGDL